MIRLSWWRRKVQKVLSFTSTLSKQSSMPCPKAWGNHSKGRVLIAANPLPCNRKKSKVKDPKLHKPKRYSLRSTSIQDVSQTKNQMMKIIITACKTLQHKTRLALSSEMQMIIWISWTAFDGQILKRNRLSHRKVQATCLIDQRLLCPKKVD